MPTAEQAKAQALGLNLYQVMTIASIVERAKQPCRRTADYRLGLLQPHRADDAVAGRSDGAVRDRHKRQLVAGDHAGRPRMCKTRTTPTRVPVCRPARSAIRASPRSRPALNPATTDYLYFVAKGDGSGQHLFAKTYDEQQQNIQKVSGNNP